MSIKYLLFLFSLQVNILFTTAQTFEIDETETSFVNCSNLNDSILTHDTRFVLALNFDTDKDILREDLKQELLPLIFFLKEHSEKTFQMICFSSEEDKCLEYSVSMVRRRIESVVYFLLKNGIFRKRIHWICYDNETPVLDVSCKIPLQKKYNFFFILEEI